jgi:hypothetical protein
MRTDAERKFQAMDLRQRVEVAEAALETAMEKLREYEGRKDRRQGQERADQKVAAEKDGSASRVRGEAATRDRSG